MKPAKCLCGSINLKPITGMMIGDPITRDREEWIIHECENCKVRGTLNVSVKNKKISKKYTVTKDPFSEPVVFKIQ